MADQQSAGFSPLTNLEFHILLSLGDEARHGYAIIKDIEQRTGGAMRPRSGTLYTAIQRLDTGGLIAETRKPSDAGNDDERRRYYRITGTGRKAAALEAHRLAKLVRTARARNLFTRPA